MGKKNKIPYILMAIIEYVFIVSTFFVPTVYGYSTGEFWHVQTSTAGAYHTMAITEDGSLWSWGLNSSGQIGNGFVTTQVDDYNEYFPKKVMEDVVSISAGESHSAAIKTDGSLWTWGDNSYGQLGDCTTINESEPKKVMTDVVAVSAGRSYTMAIKSDGSLWALGLDTKTDFGYSETDHEYSPISEYSQIKVMENVIAVSQGGAHTMAITSDGSLWAWGDNLYGQVGDNSTIHRYKPVKIMDDVASISAGHTYSMAIKKDGSLWAWGDNSYGQLGDGKGTIVEKRTSPIKIMDDVIYVSAGTKHTMAIKKDGSLWGWGDNYYGQLGNGDYGQTESSGRIRYAPIYITNQVVSVSTGYEHTVMVREDGSLWTWGANQCGQIGDGRASTMEEIFRPYPTQILTDIKIDEGTFLYPTISYINYFGGKEVQISNPINKGTIHYTVDGSEPTVESDIYLQPFQVTETTEVKARVIIPENIKSDIVSLTVTVPMTSKPTAAIEDGNIVLNCATDNARIYYTLDGSTPSQSSNLYSEPIPYIENVNIKAVAVAEGYGISSVYIAEDFEIPDIAETINQVITGGDFNLAVSQNGNLWTWGSNTNGQLGDGTTTDRNKPVKIMDSVVSVSAGSSHALAIKQDGSLWTWGSNYSGQLGDGTTTDQNKPVKIMDNVIYASAVSACTMAITEDGSLWAWGKNDKYQLGDNTNVDKNIPVKILENVSSFSTSGTHTMAIKKDGSLWGWGDTTYGEVSGSMMTDSPIPGSVKYPIMWMEHVSKVVCVPSGCTIALKENGELWAWGLLTDKVNNRGSQIKIMDAVTDVFVGNICRIFAIKQDGSLWAWGFAPLGDGSTEDKTTSVKVMDDVTKVIPGNGHILAIQSDGSLWTWGSNTNGQLGDGTTTERNEPVKIMDKVMTAAVGTSYSMATQEDGSLWTWGKNQNGLLLGDGGTSSRRLSPIEIELNPDIYLSETTLTLPAGGERRTLTVTMGHETLANDSVIWESSNPDIVSVSQGNLVTGFPGTAIVSAKHPDSGKTAGCLITVQWIEPLWSLFPTAGGTITIIGCTLSENYNEPFIIPGEFERYEGKPVTRVSINHTYPNIPEVILPDTVIHIGTFEDWSSLQKINLPDGITVLEANTFQNCTSLKTIDLPEQLSEIKDFAFANSGIESITVPKSLKNIGANAFSGCTNLNTIYYAGSETDFANITIEAGNDAFKNATVIFGETEQANITVNPSVATLHVGDTKVLTAQITGNTVNQTVLWQSDTPAVATVQDGVVTAVAPGSATITATHEDSGKTAQCRITVTEEIPEGVPTVTVQSVSVQPGDELKVAVDIKNCKGFANLGLEVDYDSEIFTLISAENNPEVGAVFVPSQDESVKPYVLTWNSVSNTQFSGTLVTLTFKVADNAMDGEYPVSISYYKGANGNYEDGNNVNYDENFESLGLHYQSGIVSVREHIPGDINGDGFVDNKDGTFLLRKLAGWNVSVDTSALDINGDGFVDNKDGTVLLRKLAGWDVEIH